MTILEIRKVFETDHEYFYLSKRKTKNGAYTEEDTAREFKAYKARWIEAFGDNKESKK